MRSIKFTLLFLLMSFFAYSQVPNIQWQKSLGGVNYETAKSVVQTPDGGYIVAGYTNSTEGDITLNKGFYDFWVVKLNSSGNIQWQKTYGGSGDDRANSIQNTPDGGYIVAGTSMSNNGDATLNKGSSDYWVIKLNNSGDIQWQKSYGSTGTDLAQCIRTTSDGGYIVTGYTNGSGGDVIGAHLPVSNDEMWTIKLDATGNIQWSRAYGGSASDKGYSIQQTTDNGYIIAGSSRSNNGDATASFGADDFWVVKTDSSGNILWQKSYGGTGNDAAFSIQQTTDGGYIVAGETFSTNGDVIGNNGNMDYWILKLDPIGNIQWSKAMGDTSYDRAYSVQQTIDGGYIVAGYAAYQNGPGTVNPGSGFWIVKLNGAGDYLWDKGMGGSNFEIPYSIQQTNDGGAIIAGYTSSFNTGDVTGSHGNDDFWVVKLGSFLSTDEKSIRIHYPLYPNPAKDFVNIDDLPKGTIISINDMSGRKIFSKTYSNQKISINTSAFINGVYMIQAEHEGKVILSEKLMIKK